VDTTHQAASLTVEVGVDLLLEGGLVEVSGADGDTKSNGLLFSLLGDVLENGDGRVDTAALTEETSDSAAGTLGSDEDDVNVGGDVNLGQVLEDGRETVGEVESLVRLALCFLHIWRGSAYLLLGQKRLDGGPRLGLGSIGEQVHDIGGLLDSLINVEQVLARNPAILLGLLPRSTVLPYTDNDVETVVAEVQTLAVALGAVADEGEGVVLEVFLLNCQLMRPLDFILMQLSNPRRTKSLSFGQSARSVITVSTPP
jgi:hypothetical protein